MFSSSVFLARFHFLPRLRSACLFKQLQDGGQFRGLSRIKNFRYFCYFLCFVGRAGVYLLISDLLFLYFLVLRHPCVCQILTPRVSRNSQLNVKRIRCQRRFNWKCSETGNNLNNFLCLSCYKVNAYQCLCPDEFTGTDCELPYSLCSRRTPCENGGCIDKGGTYECVCPTEYKGTFCELKFDKCTTNPCQNNGVCIDGSPTYACLCQRGYSGANCQINIDDCAAVAEPCKNGGTCVDGIQSYSCQCPTGYTGARCENAIDRCVGQPCRNGGKCVNTPTGYNCHCKPGFSGCRCTQGNDDIF